MTDHTPTLSHFMGAYLHQEWTDAYATWQQAVDDFLHEEPDEARDFRSEAAEVLATHTSSTQLEQTLVRLGCGFWPAPYAGDYVPWFKDFVDYVDKSVAELGH